MTSARGELTIAARLDGGLDVANALNGNSILVVPVNVLVLELADFVEQDSKLVRHVRDILISGLTPNGELLLMGKHVSASAGGSIEG